MDESRRTFLGGVAGAGAYALLGEALAQDKPAAAPVPAGTIANEAVKSGKHASMVYHSERPLTGSVPAHQHDFAITPSDRMFVRNNLLTPDLDIGAHRVTIKGLVDKELSFSVAELQKTFPTVTLQGMLECAGSGRSNYQPTASGTPWAQTGGMGCPKWTGVRLADVLKAAGLKSGAAHVAGQGGDPGMIATAAPVIRSVPLAKALDDSTLLAWEMNGAPLPKIHGYPLRLVVPGWVGSASTKWLHTLTVLDAPFKGTFMTSSYVTPKWPVEPGQKMPPDPRAQCARQGRPARHRARPRLGGRRFDRPRRDLARRRRELAAGAPRPARRPLRVARLQPRVPAAALRLPEHPGARVGQPRQRAADGFGLESARLFLERRAPRRGGG